MDFTEKMMEYAKYGFSLKKSFADNKEYYMVYMTFGTKWKVLEPVEHPGQNVVCAKVNNDGTYCYMTEVSNGIQPVFNIIDETIRYNEELAKKVELLKEKAEELKELFATRSYNELLGLEFVLKTDSKPETTKVKRQSKPTKKTPQKPQEEPIEAKIEELKEEPVPVTVGSSEPSEIDKKIRAALGK